MIFWGTKSIRAKLLRYYLILLIVTYFSFVIFISYSIWTYKQQLVYCNRAVVDIFVNQLKLTEKTLTRFNENIISRVPQFRMISLRSGRISDFEKIDGLNQFQILAKQTVPEEGAFIFFNEDHTIYAFVIGDRFVGGMTTGYVRAFMKELSFDFIRNQDYTEKEWIPIQMGDSCSLLGIKYRLNRLYVVALLDLNSYVERYGGTDSEIRYVIYTEDRLLVKDKVNSAWEMAIRDSLEKAAILPSTIFNGEVFQSVAIPTMGIQVGGIISMHGVWRYSRISLVIYLIVFCLLTFLFYGIYTVVRGALGYPLAEIMKMTESVTISDPDAGSAPRDRSGIQDREEIEEFRKIKVALNDLIEQRLALAKENHLRAIEKDHALLQYYQLQTRAHFFLNCLKNVFNLAERGEKDRIKQIILCVSNHLRYVFHDNLNLVSLAEELREVQDYYQMIQMDRANPILLNVNVDESLLEILVPPLIIQTFLENSHKYNSNQSKFLRFSIEVDRKEIDGRSYVRIFLSDNGVGYSRDVLDFLSKPMEEFERAHVGISNLKRRIALIFQDDYQIGFFNAPGGGACSTIYLPLQFKEV